MSIDLQVNKETFEIIDRLLRRLSAKYTFDSYEADDMYQEGYIIACKALKAYDPTKGTTLSTFLYKHLSRRLINFIRDHSIRTKNHCIKHSEYIEGCPNCQQRQATQDAKRGIQRPKDITNLDFSESSTQLAELEIKEVEKRINSILPKEMREDYLRMKDGDYVSRSRRMEIETKILEVINASR